MRRRGHSVAHTRYLMDPLSLLCRLSAAVPSPPTATVPLENARSSSIVAAPISPK